MFRFGVLCMVLCVFLAADFWRRSDRTVGVICMT
jgi:hypothetical protein